MTAAARKRAALPGLAPIIDTREQRPLVLPGAVRGTLATGDYSCCEAHRDVVAVERKAPGDLFACVGRERQRFVRELERLAALPFRALVIEDDLGALLARPPARSQVHPSAVLGSLAAWSWRYGLPVWFASSPAVAARLVDRLLVFAHHELAARGVSVTLCEAISPSGDPEAPPDPSTRQNERQRPQGAEA